MPSVANGKEKQCLADSARILRNAAVRVCERETKCVTGDDQLALQFLLHVLLQVHAVR